MPRIAHEPTEKTRSEVAALSSFGVPQVDIADYLDIHFGTLKKYYGEELKTAAINANLKVGKYLFHLASGNAVEDGATHGECRSAAIFWAKTRMRWRETNHVDHTNSDGSFTPLVIVTDEAPGN